MHKVQDIQSCPCLLQECVAARAGSVHLMYSNDRKLGWEGQRHTQNNTILFSQDTYCKFTDHLKPTGSQQILLLANTAQPRQHQNAHNDISAIPPHPLHNGMTHFLGGRSNTTYTQSPTLHKQTGSPPGA